MSAGAGSRCWVVKIGSTLVTNDGRGFEPDGIGRWVAQMVALRAQGVDVVVVSSGSVAEGMSRLGLPRRPEALYELQAVAAIGQMGLVQAYESCFQHHATHTAQVLLTHEDVSDRGRYLNARSTLRQLLRYRVVPVINENDAVATPEVRLGDNDTLAGLVANLVEAEMLVILTDQPGLFDRDPRADPAARLVERGRAGDAALDAMAGAGGTLGRGGMRTKLRARRARRPVGHAHADRLRARTRRAGSAPGRRVDRDAAGAGTGAARRAQAVAGGAVERAGGVCASTRGPRECSSSRAAASSRWESGGWRENSRAERWLPASIPPAPRWRGGW